MSARILMLVALSALSACATAASIAEAPPPPPPVETPPPEIAPPPTPVRQECTPSRRVRCPTPIQTLTAANGAARQRPMRGGFVQARHVYDYAPGAIYELYTSPSFISTIMLEPGEALSAVAAGDTSRWMVTETEGEADSSPRTVVLVKPQTVGLRTNIVLITDRRTYMIEASAVAGETYSAQIAWSYPETAGQNLGAPAISRLNFDYRVRTVRGRAPRWTPVRVFDDGRRTWIELAPDVIASEMPPLFIVTPEGAELVNYRVQGQRYMVDRVFDVAELRLGVRAPVIVRIERRAERGRS
ncbi:MAG: TrbG/VirB9 family P-type conjugative transfer protein [Hyphomonadaceae bacterium]|nr:TrbG/VirB9 family P-type conjugative transfer protein [Hyphomonadaceae bacterium]